MAEQIDKDYGKGGKLECTPARYDDNNNCRKCGEPKGGKK